MSQIELDKLVYRFAEVLQRVFEEEGGWSGLGHITNDDSDLIFSHLGSMCAGQLQMWGNGYESCKEAIRIGEEEGFMEVGINEPDQGAQPKEPTQ